MNKQEQRIAIAEACGWKLQSVGNKPYGTTPNGAACLNFPDYLSDLNAMHEAELTLESDPWDTYCEHLDWGEWPSVAAPASYRAEAFLKTLNLWKEE